MSLNKLPTNAKNCNSDCRQLSQKPVPLIPTPFPVTGCDMTQWQGAHFRTRNNGLCHNPHYNNYKESWHLQKGKDFVFPHMSLNQFQLHISIIFILIMFPALSKDRLKVICQRVYAWTPSTFEPADGFSWNSV